MERISSLHRTSTGPGVSPTAERAFPLRQRIKRPFDLMRCAVATPFPVSNLYEYNYGSSRYLALVILCVQFIPLLRLPADFCLLCKRHLKCGCDWRIKLNSEDRKKFDK